MKLGKIISFIFISINLLSNKAIANSVDKFSEITPKQLPNLIFYDLQNNKYFLENFAGNIIILHFWATWCSPCKEEMIHLDLFQKKVRDKPIIIVPISEDFKGAKIVEEFYKENGLTNLLSFIDKKNNNFSKLNVTGLPTTIIIDGAGYKVARAIGNIDWEDENLVQYFLKFIKKKPVANADYVNLMNKQFGNRLHHVEAKKIEPKSANIDEIFPPEAITHLQPVEIENEKLLNKNDSLPGEIKVSNMQTDKFSLKIKRPVNKIINKEGQHAK